MTENQAKKRPSIWQAIAPIIAIALLLSIGYGVFKLRVEFLLIAAAAISGLIAMRLGYTYKEMESGIVESISKGMPAILIVISVGMLIGTWIAAGTIPMLIYYGLKIISPQYFLVTACVVCSLVSVLTGTSYGTAGTLGVVFMGIAAGLHIPLGQAAGAVVAGAYFGDKMSPFSDTTNLAPMVARSNLFDHIKHLLWTTTPAFLIGLVIYYFLGLGYTGSVENAQVTTIMDTLVSKFQFSIFLLLPPCVILYFIIKKKPTVPGMFLSSFVAVLLAVIFQDSSFKDAIDTMVHGFNSQTGLTDVDKLLTKGGMMSMMDVTLIALAAFCFAGVIQKAGMLDVILEYLQKFAKTVGRLVCTTAVSSMIAAMLTGSSYLAILIPGELFAPAFRKMKLAAKNLSRTIEDSGAIVVPLIPWSVAGVYMAGTLGVSTMDYLPYAFMNYLGIFFGIIYGFTGFAIAPKVAEDETVYGS